MKTLNTIKALDGFGRWLLPVAAAFLATLTAHAQRITAGHLNAGAFSTNAGSQLTFANGIVFALESGYVQMDLATTGMYSGYYGSGPSITALPQTVPFGGPNPTAPSLGSFIELSMTLQSAPEGGSFAFWDTDATAPTFSLSLVGSTSGTWNLSGGEENPTAGTPGGDPFGHIHGRRFTATTPGEYVIGFQAFDTSANGAQHTPSDMLQVRFVAVPEPATATLAMLGGVLAVGWVFRRRFE